MLALLGVFSSTNMEGPIQEPPPEVGQFIGLLDRVPDEDLDDETTLTERYNMFRSGLIPY